MANPLGNSQDKLTNGYGQRSNSADLLSSGLSHSKSSGLIPKPEKQTMDKIFAARIADFSNKRQN
jgi:hypothetical protein